MNPETWIGIGAFISTITVGLLSYRTSKQSNRTDEIVALRAELAVERAARLDLERDYRALEDYSRENRMKMERAGMDVAPWPERLGGAPQDGS